MIDYLHIVTATITLFAVIDMLGSIPLIIKLREDYGHINSLKGSLISTAIMIVFLFFGKTIFSLLGIETHHFGLAGSFLIIYFGVRMVLDIQDNKKTKKQANSATIFPIAFPLIAGPGTLSTIISMRSEFSDLEITISILINAIIIFLVLKSAEWLKTKIGMVGITLMERIFGIILIAIGTKMFIYNLIMSLNEVLKFL
jgi:multiple antibiotic resistance protein